MPRRGGVSDAPQPIILHPIASHATFHDSTAEAAPSTTPAPETAPSGSASASASQPPASEPQQQQPGWKLTRPDRPPPEQLSFSYLRSRKLEPYLPPPVDEQHTPPSLSAPQHALALSLAPPAAQHQHRHTAGQAHHQQQQLLLQQQQQASSPKESREPSAHEDGQDANHRGAAPPPAAAADEGSEGDEEEDLDWKPRPFITLTYAQSLDSAIATSPGARTALSGPATKAMTHFLRSRHDAILVGVGTAAADDPGLNCRLEVEMGGGHQPRPVVLDPRARWDVTAGSKVVRLAAEGRGLGPWVLVAEGVVPDAGRAAVLEGVGGRYIPVSVAGGARGKGEEAGARPVLAWDSIFGVLWEEGINSVMVEGGAAVINDLLLLANEGLDVVDSVIVTVAPVWLGAGAVAVAPQRPADARDGMRRVPGPRLTDVVWTQMGDDSVLCGRIMR